MSDLEKRLAKALKAGDLQDAAKRKRAKAKDVPEPLAALIEAMPLEITIPAGLIPPPPIEVGTGRPAGGYYTTGGKRCASVTTILSKWGDSGGLLGWYYKNGITDGMRLQRGEPAIGADNFSTDALEIGSAVHARVESHLLGRTQPMALLKEEWEAKAARCFASWLEWYDGAELVPVALELPMVHNATAIAGTLDAVFRDKSGNLVLLDWKTSKDIYGKELVQAAAYRWLWEEDLRDPIARIAVLRIDKDSGRRRLVEVSKPEEHAVCLDQWLSLVGCYRRDAQIVRFTK